MPKAKQMSNLTWKNKKKKIKIAGAGISGLVAGIILAKSGYGVEIFEKRSHIGSYFKKDIHSLRNYLYDYNVISKYKKLGIKISNVYPIFKELRFSPSLKYIEIYSKDKPLFYNFFRGYQDNCSLDNELFRIAKNQGVKIYFNQVIDPNAEGVDIIATGSRFAKGIAYGRHYKKIFNLKLDSIYYFLDNRYAPQGYIYILPFLNEFSLVITTTKIESKNQLKERFNELQKSNSVIRKILENSEFKNEIFGFGFFDVPKTAMKDKKLYVGESAGFLDAATGFGTHYAILSGYLAAKAIVENKNYDRLWKNFFEEELKKQYFRRMKLQKFDNKEYEKSIEAIIIKYGNKITADTYKNLKIK